MIHAPDFDLAATSAMNILREKGLTETPVNPLPILEAIPGVRVMPFTRMAADAGMERHELVPMFGSNQDAATFHLDLKGFDDVRYVVVYNMRLPFDIVWRGIARELGHIVLGHDGTARTSEALCFAHHLLTPRPILNLMLQSGMPLTQSALSETTGCSAECVVDMQRIPGARVDPELNRLIRDQFSNHINEYIRFHLSSPMRDQSPVLDLGTFMDGYEE